MISGVIDWPRHGELTWQNLGTGGTYVFAYWLVDHRPRGLDLLDPPHTHRDWFVRTPGADYMINVVTAAQGIHASPNVQYVQDRQVLAAVCLGTSEGVYYSAFRDGYFWAGPEDLTRDGRRLLTAMNNMYARTAVLVTYLVKPMSDYVPEAPHDQATVIAASGS